MQNAAPARRRILVVEDNIDAAEFLRLVLEMEGHEVRVEHDGLDGLAAAATFRPNVVVLDIGLPGMDGYDLARALRQQPEFSTVPMFALTGYGQEEDRRKCRDAGFDGHILKPGIDELLEALFTATHNKCH